MSLHLAGITYRQEKIKCGKPHCQKCPHGPYWYAYWHAGVILKKKYVGKELPPNVQLDQAGLNVEVKELTQEEKDWLTLGLLVGTGFTQARTTFRVLATTLERKLKEELDLTVKVSLRAELQAIRESFRRLFPNRR